MLASPECRCKRVPGVYRDDVWRCRHDHENETRDERGAQERRWKQTSRHVVSVKARCLSSVLLRTITIDTTVYMKDYLQRRYANQSLARPVPYEHATIAALSHLESLPSQATCPCEHHVARPCTQRLRIDCQERHYHLVSPSSVCQLD